MTDYKADIRPICYTIAGCSSGVVSRMCGQPLDVLKIRFQLQNTVEGRLKYTSVVGSIRTIVRHEGVLAFWKGHVPAQALSVVYGIVKFTTYERLRGRLATSFPAYNDDLAVRASGDFVCGAVAGVATTLVTQPLDVIRTRLVWQEEQMYRGMRHAIKRMWCENGVHTFYKGIIPALTMVWPNMALHFTFYGMLKRYWLLVEGEEKPSNTCRLLCGAGSGLLTKLILLPLDTVKKRLQVAGFQGTYQYKGMLDCFTTLAKQQGVVAFYRGASPSLAKAAVMTGVNFYAYEKVLDVCYTFQEGNVT